jgi:hypothetical protein
MKINISWVKYDNFHSTIWKQSLYLYEEKKLEFSVYYIYFSLFLDITIWKTTP